MGMMSGESAATLPASETEERASIENVEAQKASEADSRHGEAGVEAKPFAGKEDAPHRPGDSEMPADEPNDMISGRRNAGRDDASDAAGRPPESSSD